MKRVTKTWFGIGLIFLGIGLLVMILTLIVGAGWRYTHNDYATYSVDESYQGVQSLNIEISLGNVKIEEGDAFHIRARHLFQEDFLSEVEDGVWTIQETGSQNEIFGIPLPKKQLKWDEDDIPEIIITVPNDFIAENITMKVGAGTLTAETLQAVQGKFKVGVGEIVIHGLKVREQSYYDVGAGQMKLDSIDVNDIKVNCGVGSITLAGSVTGDSFISTGIGEVKLQIDGDEEDYSYKIESGIGSIKINQNEYIHFGNQKVSNNNADHSLELKCGLGNIIVEID